MSAKILEYLFLILCSALPALSFAMLFSVPKRYLHFVALGGMIAYATKLLSQNLFNIDLVVSSFLASSAISFAFIFIAPKLKVPRPVFTVASIIPILPGQAAYLTLNDIIQIYTDPANEMFFISEFFRNGLLTTGVMVAIGMGIALPPLLFYRNHPVV